MTSGSNVFLVDTNVLVYAYDQTDGTKRERAIQVLDRIGANGTGAITPQIMGEFFVTVTRKIPSPLRDDIAESRLVAFTETWRVFDLTAAIVLEAVRGLQKHRLSYWDALIWATAKLNGVGVLLAEDMQHGRLLEGVRFQNPFVPEFDEALLAG